MPAAATRTRPNRTRAGRTIEVNIGGMDVHLVVTELPDGSPGEVFLRAGKQGSTLAGLCEALSLTTSLALQHGVPLAEIAARLQGMHYEPAGVTTDRELPRVTSLSDWLARRLLADYARTAPAAAAADAPEPIAATNPSPATQARVIRLPETGRLSSPRAAAAAVVSQ